MSDDSVKERRDLSIAGAYASGMSLRQVAMRFMINHETVRRALLRGGFMLRTRQDHVGGSNTIYERHLVVSRKAHGEQTNA